MPQVLSRLDALVLPTVTQEAFGRVLIEAGACGVPVIASRVGGIVDIIQDGVNGVLVEPKSPADLASAIIRLFKDPGLGRRFVQAARKNVEQNFTLKQMAERTIRVYEEVQASLRILVVKLSALGDVILAIPSLRALRENFPQADITVLVGAPHKSVLQNCPYINQVLEFPMKNKTYRDVWEVAALLRRLDFDIVIDLQNSRKSHILSYLSACNRRYGYDNGKFGFLLNKRIKEIKKPLSPIEHQARSLRLLDIESVKEDLELWPKQADEIWAEDFLNNHRREKANPLIGINLGASSSWPTKKWEIAKVAALLDKMQEAGMQILVTGEAKDRKPMQVLRKLCKSSFINAVGETQLLQLACLIKRCHVYISSDSAPLHIAYAMKTPVVALFGPTDPRRHTLLGARQVVIKKKIDCSPCYRRDCRKHSCMKEITKEAVFGAVKILLG